MKLTIGYFYPNILNLYGDDGNVQVLKYRAEKRGIKVDVVNITLETKDIPPEINLVFMGGGPDSGQQKVYEDLINNKGSFLREYIENKIRKLYQFLIELMRMKRSANPFNHFFIFFMIRI